MRYVSFRYFADAFTPLRHASCFRLIITPLMLLLT